MKPFFFGIRDLWSRWAVDEAGMEIGSPPVPELRRMLDRGEVTPHTWLRHVWTRKFALVGEVLLYNDLATQEEFDRWFPNPKVERRRPSLA
jgi:hypothetical protein